MGGTRFRWALALGAVMVAMLPARDASASGHRGGGFHHGGFHHGGFHHGGFHHGGFHHGGFHHGGFHHGGFVGVRVGFGFGFGCCWGGWYPPYYGYPAYAYPPAYAYAPSYAYPASYVTPASYVSPAAPAAADCQEYRMAATIGSRPETIIGVACRQPDGSWHPAR